MGEATLVKTERAVAPDLAGAMAQPGVNPALI